MTESQPPVSVGRLLSFVGKGGGVDEWRIGDNVEPGKGCGGARFVSVVCGSRVLVCECVGERGKCDLCRESVGTSYGSG